VQKLLIDENLSPSLVGLAIGKGFVCSHVNHLALAGQKDWELKAAILEGDWTFVTNNGIDFRGPAKSPGSQGVYSSVSLHAGLICVEAPGGLNLQRQKRLFDLVLSDLIDQGDLMNQVLEVILSTDGSVELNRFAMPPSTG
jgi:Domain of unknown function (DUF5615)